MEMAMTISKINTRAALDAERMLYAELADSRELSRELREARRQTTESAIERRGDDAIDILATAARTTNIAAGELTGDSTSLKYLGSATRAVEEASKTERERVTTQADALDGAAVSLDETLAKLRDERAELIQV
jgi:hypothetical protein